MTGSVVVSSEGTTTIVSLTGEIDVAMDKAVGAAFTRALEQAAGGGGRIVVDLGGVTFLDSSGIGQLLAGRARAVDEGAAFAVRNPDARSLRTLQLTGTTQILDVLLDDEPSATAS